MRNTEVTLMNNSIANNGELHRGEKLVCNTGTKAVTMLEIRMDAQKYPRLYTYDRREGAAELAKILSKAYLYKGQEMVAESVLAIAVELYDLLLEDDKPRTERIGTDNLTFEEIRRVIQRSVLGQGTEMFGLNIASFYKVLADYCNGEGRNLNNQMLNAYRSNTLKAQENAMQQLAPVAAALAENFTTK